MAKEPKTAPVSATEQVAAVTGEAGTTVPNSDAGQATAVTGEAGTTAPSSDAAQAAAVTGEAGTAAPNSDAALAAAAVIDVDTAIPAAAETIVYEQVLIVTAPGGPRRRAGFAFGPQPVELTQAQLGSTVDEIKETVNLLRGDPLLKIDGRFVESPASDD